MATTISQRVLRNENAAVIERVLQGEEFTVTRNGQAVAELRPVSPPRREFVSRDELLELADVGPRLDYASFRADLSAALDEGIA